MWTNPPTGVKRGKGAVAADPKGVTPADRVRAYPNEPFSVSNKKLFCMACRDELVMKKSEIDIHVKSDKHAQGKKRLSSKKKHDKDIIQALGNMKNFTLRGNHCLLLRTSRLLVAC